MNLDEFSIKIRPRKTWEAMDLGVSLTKKHWKTIYAFWGLWTLSLLILFYTLLKDDLTWAGVLFWYFVAWGERIPLWILSRSVFASPPTFKESLKFFPRSLFKGFFAFFFYLRFMPWRSYLQSVWLLEEQKGTAASKRNQSLKPMEFSGGFGFGVVWAHLEGIFYIGILVVSIQMIPSTSHQQWAENFIDDQSIPSILEQLNYWIFGLTVFLLRPIYVAGGFSLYLHKRMELEGWDIELHFRRLAQRLKPALSLCLLAFSFIFFSPSLQATEEVKPQELITEIMAEPEMSKKKEVEVLFDFSSDDKEETKEPQDMPNVDLSILATLVKFVVIIALVAFVAYLIHLFIKNLDDKKVKPVKEAESKAETKVTKVGNLDIRREALPKDVVGAVQHLLNQGELRQALALLYRCFLSRLVHVHHGALRSSHTEMECLRVAQKMPKEELLYFTEVTNLWVKAAYAHSIPDVADLRDLAQRWDKMEAVNGQK